MGMGYNNYDVIPWAIYGEKCKGGRNIQQCKAVRESGSTIQFNACVVLTWWSNVCRAEKIKMVARDD